MEQAAGPGGGIVAPLAVLAAARPRHGRQVADRGAARLHAVSLARGLRVVVVGPGLATSVPEPAAPAWQTICFNNSNIDRGGVLDVVVTMHCCSLLLTVLHVVEPLVRVVGAGAGDGGRGAARPGHGRAAQEVVPRGRGLTVQAAAVHGALAPAPLQTLNIKHTLNIKLKIKAHCLKYKVPI